MEKWKQNLGPNATYNNLIKVFEQAGYEMYAEIVKGLLMKSLQTDSEDFDRNTFNQTPPPLQQPLSQLPVFPSQSEQSLESPSYASAAKVKLLQDSQPGTKDSV